MKCDLTEFDCSNCPLEHCKFDLSEVNNGCITFKATRARRRKNNFLKKQKRIRIIQSKHKEYNPYVGWVSDRGNIRTPRNNAERKDWKRRSNRSYRKNPDDFAGKGCIHKKNVNIWDMLF